MRVGKLKDHEFLRLARRRMDLKQADMARYLGVGMRQYRRWEDADEPLPDRVWHDRQFLSIATAPLSEVEQCVVLRQRAGYSRARMARMLRVSPTWVTQMERETVSAEKLIAFWKKRDAA